MAEGYKDWAAGDILTAADLEDYTVKQSVMRFADASARTSALSGVLAEGMVSYLKDTNSVEVYDGTTWAPIAAAGGIAIFNETQSSGTHGGSFNSGSYVKRVLNTTVVNTIAGASIASSVITLPAGTYEVQASAPAHDVNAHKIRLQDTTNTTTLALGSSSYISATDDSQTRSMLSTVITLAGSTNIELQHRCSTTKATNGFGIFSSFGDDEIYSQITIRAL